MEGGGKLAELWRNIWPWSDLNAKGPPERWLSLGLDILPALAVLAAQGPNEPRLLRADDGGRLVIAGPLNPGAQLTAPVTPGGSQFIVTDSSVFPVGTYFIVVPGPNRAGGPDGHVFQVQFRNGQQLNTFDGSPLNVSYAAGDFLVALTRQYAPEQDPSRAGQVNAFVIPAAGVRAAITIGGAIGQTIRIIRLRARLVSVAAVLSAPDIHVNDNFANTYWRHYMSIPGVAGSHDEVNEEEMWLDVPGIAAQNIEIGFSAVVANTAQSIDVQYKVIQN